MHPDDPQRVLVIQRGNQTHHWPAHFEFAGGGRDAHDDGGANIIKEIEEESGIRAEIIAKLPFVHRHLVEVEGSPILGRIIETHFWGVVALAQEVPAIQLESGEALSYQWVLWQDLGKLLLTPQTIYAMEMINTLR